MAKTVEMLASEMVKDGKTPNTYFIGVDGTRVAMMVRLESAKKLVSTLSGRGKIVVEDRLVGTVYDSSKGGDWPSEEV